ncbi:MAG: hypothetical protein II092_10295, partial [Lachnospiraceae bacterium]|nr:hypothetical protein [Lachnospiraceae bacterium]
NPFKYQDEKGDWQYITKTLEWLWKPIVFHRPQADLAQAECGAKSMEEHHRQGGSYSGLGAQLPAKNL